MGSGNGKTPSFGFDHEDERKTPIEIDKKRRTTEIAMVEPERIGPIANPSDHPRVKTARVWHSTITTGVACLVIGVLAAIQQWPYEVSLAALGLATGLWAVGALRR